MESLSNQYKVREVINQVVNDPAYKKIAKIALFSLPQIGLIILSYTLLIGGIYLNIAFEISLWILYPVMILGVYCSFTPLHDATHRALSSNALLNDALGSISGFLIIPFLTTSSYRYLHLTHHRYVGDSDMDPDDILVNMPTKYFPFGYLILLIPDYAWAYWLFAKGWKRTPKKLKIEILIVFAISTAFHVAWFSSPYWYEYLTLFYIPSRLGLACTAYAFAHIQHTDGVLWSEHPFQATYKIKGNFYLLKSLLGQSDHWLHHFVPHIPWFNYEKVSKLANGAFFEQSLPERTVFGFPDKEDVLNLIKETSSTQRTFDLNVVSIVEETPDIKSFIFEPPIGETLLSFTAGSHINIQLPSGKIRTYSLVNAPFDRDRYQIAVKCEPEGKGGSKEIHQKVTAGDQLTVWPPRNNFMLYENVKKYILISGGIGITPLLSIAHRLTELEKHFEFHICSKTRESIPFKFELENWTFAPNIEFHFDKGGKSTIDLYTVLGTPDSDTLVYLCGPAGFNNWIKSSAINLGWAEDQIKLELFSLNTIEFAESKEFDLVLQRSGKSLTVKKDSSIIDALLLNDIKVDYTCLQGTCGTCVTNVIEGAIDHRDAVLTEQEKIAGQKMCLCVSRATSDTLVIDL